MPRRIAAAAALAALAASLAFAGGASAVSVTEFPVPTDGSAPNEIVAGSDGALWYTNLRKPLLGRVDPASGSVEEFDIPYPGAEIVTGPDGRLWLTMFTSIEVGAPKRMVVGAFDPTTRQMVKVFDDITVNGGTAWITTGAGKIWVAVNAPNAADGRRIVRIDPDTLLTTALRPPFVGATATFSCCNLVTFGPDGKVYAWGDDYTDASKQSLQESLFGLDPATGALTGPFDAPVTDLSPYDAEQGPDGALWFTNNAKPAVTRFDPASGSWTQVDLPETALRAPLRELAAGQDGYLWLTQAGVLSRVDPVSRKLDQFPIPTPEKALDGLTVAADGALWFTEQDSGNVGRVDLDSKEPDVGNLDTVLGKGVNTLVECDGPCRGTVDAILLRREGARGSKAGAARRAFKRIGLAHAAVRLRRSGTRQAVLRLPERAKQRLRRTRSTARVQVVIRTRAGSNRHPRTRTIRRTLLLRDYRGR